MILRHLILLVVYSLVLAACTSQDDKSKMQIVKMSNHELQVTIPTAIWKSVENDYAQFNMKKTEGTGKPEQENEEAKPREVRADSKKLQINKKELETLLKRRPPSQQFPITVTLIEKTEGVLSHKNYELQYAAGGGVLDFNRFVAESPTGSFYFRVDWDKKELPYKLAKVYFASRSKVRETSHGKFGSGCNAYFDVTAYFINQMKDGGMFLNTADLRHLSLLTGTYYFLIFKEGIIHLASLEIFDSRHRDLMCIPN